jgi:uncharacterized membrane protein
VTESGNTRKSIFAALPGKQLYLVFVVLLYAFAIVSWVNWSQNRPPTVNPLAIVQQGAVAALLSLLASAAYFSLPTVVIRGPIESLRQETWARRLLLITVLLYVTVFTYFTFQRHWHFNSAGFDLGIQDQVVWNTAHGRWYQSSLEVSNYLGDHFQPLMALLAIPYRIWPSAYILLAFQTIVLALGALPLYRLATRRLNSPLVGLLFATLYLLYPSVGYINRFDFHWEATAVPLLIAAVDAADEERWRAMSLFLFLALFGKEDIGLTVSAFGVWLALRKRTWVGAVWAVAGVAYSLVALFVFIPAFRGIPSDTLHRYGWLGDTPLQMVQTLILDPGAVASHLAEPQTAIFLFTLLGPVLFLPLFSSQSLVLLPAIGYNLLAQNHPPQHTIYFQYVAPLVPFVLTSTVYGVERLLAFAPTRHSRLLRFSLLVALFTFALWHVTAISNPLVDNERVSSAWDRLPNAQAVRRGLDQVPADGSVFTTNHYTPHLSHRQEIYTFIFPEDAARIQEVDTLFLNLRDHRSVVAKLNCERYQSFLKTAEEHNFGVLFNEDGVVVLHRPGNTIPSLPRNETC